MSGRGGSGNIHQASERPMFLFDEDMDRLASRGEPAPVIHVGRGGAGNWALVDPSLATTNDTSTRTNTNAGNGVVDHHYDETQSNTAAASSARKSRDSGQSVNSAECSNFDSDGHCNSQGHGIWHRLGHTLSRS